jgi:sugar lactone lactonase YvrE
MRTEQVTPAICGLGEGPVWDQASGSLLWVDLLVGDVIRLRPDGSTARHRLGVNTIGALRPRHGGGFVLAAERGFAFADPDLSSLEVLADLWDDRNVRMNDGACDPHGRFLAGSMAYDAEPGAGRLFRLDSSGTVEQVLGPVTISNGLDWSPDGSLAYYVDTVTQRIDVFDDDPIHGLTNRRPFVRIAPELGAPDGITVDAAGGVWVALWGGAAVHRYDATGVLSAIVDVPATNVTACTFGGPDLADLYVTTSRRDGVAHARSRPEAEGALHVIRIAGLHGTPPRAFGEGP